MEIFFLGGGHSFIDSKRKNGFVGGIVEGNCDGTRPIFGWLSVLFDQSCHKSGG